MIKIDNVTKMYGKKEVLKGVTLTIKDGEIVCLLGKNGAGKSTLLNIITKLSNQTSGNIICNGLNSKSNEIKYKEQIGYVPDSFKGFDFFTGNEYINFLLNIYCKSIDTGLINYYINLFQLETEINNKISTYSSGTKKKISLIGNLIIDPSILILDEPEQGLDIYIREVLINELRRFVKNKSILISTHDVSIMENLCDKIAILSNGIIKEPTGSAISLIKYYKKDTIGQVFWEVNQNV